LWLTSRPSRYAFCHSAVWGTQAFAQGGLDISTPGDGLGGLFGKFFGNELLAFVANGTIDDSRVQDQAIRVLTPYFVLGRQDDPLPPPTQRVSTNYLIPSVNEYRNVQKGSTVDLIRRIGEEGAVLLKNTGGLPLQKPRRLLVVGEDAGYHRAAGDFGNGGPINTFSLGFGSGYAIPNNLIDPLAAISMRALQDQTTIETVLNNTNIPLIASLASQADVALVFSEALTGQGTERRDLNLTRNGTEIILATAAQCSNTVVVLHLPGAVNLEAFVDHPNITAILAPMLPGEQTGTSLVRLLYGDVNPSGKLPFTSQYRLYDRSSGWDS
jgi:beta-glucosidase